MGKASAVCCFEICYYLYSQEDSPYLRPSCALFGPGVNKLSCKGSGDDDVCTGVLWQLFSSATFITNMRSHRYNKPIGQAVF